MANKITSFGRYFKVQPKSIVAPYWLDEIIKSTMYENTLTVGNLKSYGDSCLSGDNNLIQTINFNKLISFDIKTGILKAEVGISLEDIINFIVPRGWFLPVTPGTKYITLGGAISNDVHGKNHHKFGTFGSFINSFELLTSDGQIRTCSPNENSALYNATIGGLGLTGTILTAEMRCFKIETSYLDVENIKFKSVKDFYAINDDSVEWESTVAWVDIANDCRGIYNRGNFSNRRKYGLKLHSEKKINFPLNYPFINNFTISIFNQLFYSKQLTKIQKITAHYEPFYYPLDKLLNWNKVYGNKGLFQYQFVIPLDARNELNDIVKIFKKYNQKSFLTVLKTFGELKSPGLMSFPKPGITMAVDFKYNDKLHKCLAEADKIVMAVGGRLYPAKDSRMSAEDFYTMFPNIEEYKKYIDPNYSSDFSKRMNLTK